MIFVMIDMGPLFQKTVWLDMECGIKARENETYFITKRTYVLRKAAKAKTLTLA